MNKTIGSRLNKLVDDCNKAAEIYEKSPGLVQPATVIDLYRTIALLAGIVAEVYGEALRKTY